MCGWDWCVHNRHDLDALLLEEIAQLRDGSLARTGLDLVVCGGTRTFKRGGGARPGECVRIREPLSLTMVSHEDARVAAVKANARCALRPHEQRGSPSSAGSAAGGNVPGRACGCATRHLLHIDLRVGLAVHKHVLDTRDGRACRGQASGLREVRAHSRDLRNLRRKARRVCPRVALKIVNASRGDRAGPHQVRIDVLLPGHECDPTV